MDRVLKQHGVTVLEQLFEKSISDAKVLAQLQHELGFREVPKARALLGRVQGAIAELGRPGGPLASATERQGTLWNKSTTSAAAAPTPPPSQSKSANQSPFAQTEKTSESAHEMSLEDAYRLLKVAGNATWEEVERSRCTLVQQSHPSRLATLSPQRKLQALTDAKLVNHAYHVVARRRIVSR
jgi:hypothetical protein